MAETSEIKMDFMEKVRECQMIFDKYSLNSIDVEINGPRDEEIHYRNKCDHTFNDKFSRVNLPTIEDRNVSILNEKIILINDYVQKVIYLKKNFFKVRSLFIKCNYNQNYQLCFCLEDLLTVDIDELEKDNIVKANIINWVCNFISIIGIKIVSVSYHYYDKKIPVKNRQFHLGYGTFKIEEKIGLLGDYGMDVKVLLSPHSFSRINYSNSIIVYQLTYNIIRNNWKVKDEGIICFGRDTYVPLKLLFNSGFSDSDCVHGITHCPITYKDICDDVGIPNSNIQFVRKKDYCKGIADIMGGVGEEGCVVKKYFIILTAGRNGLGDTLCSFIIENVNINKLVYISCNRGSMDLDMGQLVSSGFTIRKCMVSNEFSGTLYNNTIIYLER